MKLIREHYENGPEHNTISTSEYFHLTRFIEFMEIEDDGYDVIDLLCSENPTRKLDQALLNTPDLLTKRSFGGHTILDYACMVDNVELVTHLLDLGVPSNLADAEGLTSLHFAIRCGAWRSARLLVTRGYPVNTSNKYGFTPLTSTIQIISLHGIEAIRFAKTLLLLGADAGVQTSDGRGVWHLISSATSHEEDIWELYQMLFEAGGGHAAST